MKKIILLIFFFSQTVFAAVGGGQLITANDRGWYARITSPWPDAPQTPNSTRSFTLTPDGLQPKYSGPLPFDKSGSLSNRITSFGAKVTASSMAKSVIDYSAGIGKAIVSPSNIGLTALLAVGSPLLQTALNEACLTFGVGITNNTQTGAWLGCNKVIKPLVYYRYTSSQVESLDPTASFAATMQGSGATGLSASCPAPPSGSTQGQIKCTRNYTWNGTAYSEPADFYYRVEQSTGNSTTKVEITNSDAQARLQTALLQQIADDISAQRTDGSRMEQLAKELIAAGVVVQDEDDETNDPNQTRDAKKVIGPASIALGSTTSTKTNPDGSTVTTTVEKTLTLTYDPSGNLIKTTTDEKVTTVTTAADGTKTTSVTDTKSTPQTDPNTTPKEETKPDTDPGPGLPPIPELYKRKYDTLKKIWDEKKTAIDQSPIKQLVTQLMPNWSDGGTPPTWSIDLNISSWGMLGVHQIRLPDFIWPILKALTILSALILSRKLIFGG